MDCTFKMIQIKRNQIRTISIKNRLHCQLNGIKLLFSTSHAGMNKNFDWNAITFEKPRDTFELFSSHFQCVNELNMKKHCTRRLTFTNWFYVAFVCAVGKIFPESWMRHTLKFQTKPNSLHLHMFFFFFRALSFLSSKTHIDNGDDFEDTFSELCGECFILNRFRHAIAIHTFSVRCSCFKWENITEICWFH